MKRSNGLVKGLVTVAGLATMLSGPSCDFIADSEGIYASVGEHFLSIDANDVVANIGGYFLDAGNGYISISRD